VPRALHFRQLMPDTRYRVELFHQDVPLNDRLGSFATMPVQASRMLNIAVVSCDRMQGAEGTGQEAWQELHSRVLAG
jgi:PhoD-like phosphatase